MAETMHRVIILESVQLDAEQLEYLILTMFTHQYHPSIRSRSQMLYSGVT